MSETIELIQPILGLKPYILIEFNDADLSDTDDPQVEIDGSLDLTLRLGGGVDQSILETLLECTLEMVRANLPADSGE